MLLIVAVVLVGGRIGVLSAAGGLVQRIVVVVAIVRVRLGPLLCVRVELEALLLR